MLKMPMIVSMHEPSAVATRNSASTPRVASLTRSDVLQDQSGSRRVMLVGDMRELGPDAVGLHERTGRQIAQRNQRNVLIDAIGVGITAGVGSFLSVFMVRLGASDFQVGLLTAMPALTGMLLAMPAGEFLSRRTHIVPWFARSRFLVLICYVLTGLARKLLAPIWNSDWSGEAKFTTIVALGQSLGLVIVAEGVENAAQRDLLAEDVAAQVVALAGGYSHLLFPATASGKNIAPRVAALLDVAQISDATKIVSADTFERPIYAGNAIATVQSADAIKVITVRTTGFDPAAATSGSAAVEAVAAAGSR